MALSGWSTSNYIRVGSGLVTATPLSLACWYYPTSFASAACVIDLHNSASAAGADSFRLQMTTSGEVTAATNGPAGNANTTNTASLNTWVHMAGVFSSATSRSAFINGGDKTTNTTSATPAGINETTIGLRRGTTPNAAALGSIAEAAIWNAALTDDEVAALGKGYSPRLIRPGSLVAYLPIIRDFVDVHGAGFSVTGSLTVSNHCAIRG